MTKTFSFLVLSVLLATQAWANPVSIENNLFRDSIVTNTKKDGEPVYARILCRRHAEVCHFTDFFLGKVNSYDPLIPWFADDDVSVANVEAISIIYQTGEIVLNNQVIGHAYELLYGEKVKRSGIEFTVPISVDRDSRTLSIGQ